MIIAVLKRDSDLDDVSVLYCTSCATYNFKFSLIKHERTYILYMSFWSKWCYEGLSQCFYILCQQREF